MAETGTQPTRTQRHGAKLRGLAAIALAMALPAALGLLLNGCSQSEGPKSGTFGNVYANTLSTTCRSCHQPGGTAYSSYNVLLDFSSQNNAYSTLLGRTVSGTSSVGTCGGIRIVSPSAPTSSYLAAVTVSSYNTSNFAGVNGCTPLNSHLTAYPLSASEQTSLIAWINAGAAND